MTSFDPIALRSRLDSNIGYRWSLNKTFEEMQADGALSSWADSDILTAVKCILVGYDAPAKALLARAAEWLAVAIAEEEVRRLFPEPWGKAQRHHDLAFCNWLLSGRHDSENLALCMAYRVEYFAQPKPRPDKGDVGFASPEYVNARAWREALALFERARLKPPPSVTRVQSEGQMSYVLCRHALGEQYSVAEVEAAKRPFLKRNIPIWLRSGHHDRAAVWMKILRWQGEENQQAAWDAVLACYDYLDVSRPPPPDVLPEAALSASRNA